jgi:hypothetical protein
MRKRLSDAMKRGMQRRVFLHLSQRTCTLAPFDPPILLTAHQRSREKSSCAPHSRER